MPCWLLKLHFLPYFNQRSFTLFKGYRIPGREKCVQGKLRIISSASLILWRKQLFSFQGFIIFRIEHGSYYFNVFCFKYQFSWYFIWYFLFIIRLSVKDNQKNKTDCFKRRVSFELRIFFVFIAKKKRNKIIIIIMHNINTFTCNANVWKCVSFFPDYAFYIIRKIIVS